MHARFKRFFASVQHYVVLVEPWGILLAVLAILLSTVSFWLDYKDRVEERTVRAWQLLTTAASGNSGKIAALEYLNREDGICWGSRCWIILKERQPLVGIRLEGTWLKGVNLNGANLESAVFSGVELAGASFVGAKLNGATFERTNVEEANFADAELVDVTFKETWAHGASFDHAVIVRTGLDQLILFDRFEFATLNAISVKPLLESNIHGETATEFLGQLLSACHGDPIELPQYLQAEWEKFSQSDDVNRVNAVGQKCQTKATRVFIEWMGLQSRQ